MQLIPRRTVDPDSVLMERSELVLWITTRLPQKTEHWPVHSVHHHYGFALGGGQAYDKYEDKYEDS